MAPSSTPLFKMVEIVLLLLLAGRFLGFGVAYSEVIHFHALWRLGQPASTGVFTRVG